MTIVELSVNIAISGAAGAASGYGIFKFLGKKLVENWFAFKSMATAPAVQKSSLL